MVLPFCLTSNIHVHRPLNDEHWMWYTVYPKKYAHGFCFAVLCCDYTLTDFPISIRLTSLALWQSNDCPSASKQPWWIWINTLCEFIMNDCITTTKQSTTKPCAYFLGYTVYFLWIYKVQFLWLASCVGVWEHHHTHIILIIPFTVHNCKHRGMYQ